MKNYFNLFVALLCIMFAPGVFAQGGAQIIGQAGDSNPVQTAVPFLRISPDARSGGMGDTGLAVSPDANSVFWNSAKLPFTEDNAGVALNYTPWLASLDVDDVHFINAGGYYKLDQERVLNLGVRFFSLGDTQFLRTATDTPVNVTPQEFSIQAGYAQKLSDIMGLGVNLKFIHSNLARDFGTGANTKPGNSVAGDINWYIDPEKKGNVDLAFAATLTNLGAKISYLADAENTEKDFLPTNLGLGANATFDMNEYSKLSFALDVNKLLVPTPESNTDTSFKEDSVIQGLFNSWGDAPGGFEEELQEFVISVGGEYDYNDQFFGRAGYLFEHEDKGARQFATVGAGIKFDIAEIDLSYLFTTNNSNTPLDQTLRFGVKFDINAPNTLTGN